MLCETFCDIIADNGYEPIVIATKLDKINRSQTAKNLRVIRDKLKVREGIKIIPFSAQTRQGREEIYETIDEILKDNS